MVEPLGAFLQGFGSSFPAGLQAGQAAAQKRQQEAIARQEAQQKKDAAIFKWLSEANKALKTTDKDGRPDLFNWKILKAQGQLFARTDESGNLQRVVDTFDNVINDKDERSRTINAEIFDELLESGRFKGASEAIQLIESGGAQEFLFKMREEKRNAGTASKALTPFFSESFFGDALEGAERVESLKQQRILLKEAEFLNSDQPKILEEITPRLEGVEDQLKAIAQEARAQRGEIRAEATAKRAQEAHEAKFGNLPPEEQRVAAQAEIDQLIGLLSSQERTLASLPEFSRSEAGVIQATGKTHLRLSTLYAGVGDNERSDNHRAIGSELFERSSTMAKALAGAGVAGEVSLAQERAKLQAVEKTPISSSTALFLGVSRKTPEQFFNEGKNVRLSKEDFSMLRSGEAAFQKVARLTDSALKFVERSPEAVGTSGGFARGITGLFSQVRNFMRFGADRGVGIDLDVPDPTVGRSEQFFNSENPLYVSALDQAQITNPQLRSTLLSLAFTTAAIHGQTNRALSDKDVQFMIQIIGASAESPEQLKAVLRLNMFMAHEAYQDTFSSITRFRKSNIPGSPFPSKHIQDMSPGEIGKFFEPFPADQFRNIIQLYPQHIIGDMMNRWRDGN